jgi:peptidoglycan/xylan/chitin deacetylase (PgdA/CDA1 family)
MIGKGSRQVSGTSCEGPPVLKRLVKAGVGAAYHFLFVRPRILLCRILRIPVRRLVILCYHNVRTEERRAFAWQMDELLRAGSPSDLNGTQADPSGGLFIAVTFDDGYAEIRSNALPELEERGIPSTIFVPSGNLGGRPRWDPGCEHRTGEERIFTAAELRELRFPLVRIGSHTVSHADLTRLGPEEAAHELRRSREELEGHLGYAIDRVAFPYGAGSEDLVRLSRSTGYRFGLTNEPEVMLPGENGFLLGRVRVDPSDWKIEFWLKVRGAYEIFVPFQRWRKRAGRKTG